MVGAWDTTTVAGVLLIGVPLTLRRTQNCEVPGSKPGAAIA